MAAQICAVIIFVVMFALIIMDKIPRQWVTLGCGLATIVIVFGICMKSPSAIMETLNVKSIFTPEFWHVSSQGGESSSGINWATIIFIAGMMVMVEGMAKAGFFRWLCLTIAKAVKYKVMPILVTFMIMSAVLSMFIDSITVILFLAAVTVELSQLLKFSPVPMVLAEVFCANLGGSATMCGDPPNIIIGTALGYSFADFLTNTGLIAGISLVFIVIFFYFSFKKELSAANGEPVDPATFPNPADAIENKKDFIVSTIIFLIAVVLLVTHAQTGLTVAFIGVIIAAITLITSFKHIKFILKKIDYKTLLFFIGLFIVVGGLEQTGVLKLIANFIEKICGGNFFAMVLIIMWISAVASAFVDNIPFAATMVPVIKSLAATTPGAELATLAYSLSVGTDIGGSATPIGASANVVGTSVVSKAGHPVSWGKYCKSAIPATAIVLIISMIVIKLRYF
ncbi:SLC13 family permease [Eubacterium coprostanoligenes]|uniref:Possible tyrosine transporter P-protein (TC 2.A.45.2.1) n=1 Tax=Eubacterium coprostanoligenes TaxID=290054 RepID=A0A1T4K3B2_9FIRM|nr:SLC13 family permease [Eubacterium coprostanoligenes]SJZ36942.1 possible tyrosine transporter P-protein (TC 2.A.45.2.1) [Eubacterium coprostanoligenes]